MLYIIYKLYIRWIPRVKPPLRVKPLPLPSRSGGSALFHKSWRRRRQENFEGVWGGRREAPTSKKLKNEVFRRAPKARGEKNGLLCQFWRGGLTLGFKNSIGSPLLDFGRNPARGGGLTLGMHLITQKYISAKILDDFLVSQIPGFRNESVSAPRAPSWTSRYIFNAYSSRAIGLVLFCNDIARY